MTKTAYGIGDHVFLVNGPSQMSRPDGEFKIVACLPDVNGAAQYRVRSNVETFERRIVDSDIDAERSQRPHSGEQSPPASEPKGAWFKPAAIKIGK